MIILEVGVVYYGGWMTEEFSFSSYKKQESFPYGIHTDPGVHPPHIWWLSGSCSLG